MKAFCISLLYTLPLLAQRPAPVRKDTVVVTGSLEPIALEESERLVTVQQLRTMELLLNTVIDALRLDSTVDVRQRGPNGIQADMSIRGASFGQTLVLVDGRRMNDPQSGHHNMDLPMPLESIERVEVLHGAGSSLYGSDAVGGVINIITAPPKTGEIRLQTALGNFHVNQERVAITGIHRKLSEQLAFSRDFSTGFTANRDYRNMSAESTTRWSSWLGPTDLDLGYADKPFGAQGFYGPYPSWERTKTWFASMRQGLGNHMEASFSYRRHTDLFVLYRDQPERYRNDHIAESWQGTLRRHDALTRNVRVSYGGEGFGDSIVSSNLGMHSRARGAAYASLDVRMLHRWSMTAAVRGEVFKGFPGQWSPSLGLGYWASSKVKFRASGSRAFRLPTYTDLFYRDPVNIGNPLLRPERALSYEAGVDMHPSAIWKIQTTIFQRRDTDGIDYVRPIGAMVWNAVNIQRLRFTGFETSATLKYQGSQFDFSYTVLRGEAAGLAGLESKYAFNYLTSNGLVGWIGRMPYLPGAVTVRTRIGLADRKNYKTFPAWDVFLARRLGMFRPFVQFTNLTNTYSEDIPGVANPGRAVVGGIELVWPGR